MTPISESPASPRSRPSACRRGDVGTLLVRGAGLLGLPRPDRLDFRFGTPIPTTDWARRAYDLEALAECRDLVRSEIEVHINYLRTLRDGEARRRLLPRAVDAVRAALPVEASTDQPVPDVGQPGHA